MRLYAYIYCMTLVPAKPERFDCLLANDKIIPLRWGRAFARLGELASASSIDCLTARRESKGIRRKLSELASASSIDCLTAGRE